MLDLFKNYVNSTVSDNQIVQIIEANEEYLNNEIEKIFEKQKNSDISDIIENLKLQLIQEFDNELFVNEIIDYMSTRITPFIEMKYLRDLNQKNFEEVISYLFNNLILQNEDLELIIEHTNLEKRNIMYAKKLLNTLLNWVIIKRYTKLKFNKSSYKLFRFNEDKCDFLWELYLKNNEKLVQIALLDGLIVLESIRNNTNALLSVFDNIFSDESEDTNHNTNEK